MLEGHVYPESLSGLCRGRIERTDATERIPPGRPLLWPRRSTRPRAVYGVGVFARLRNRLIF